MKNKKRSKMNSKTKLRIKKMALILTVIFLTGVLMIAALNIYVLAKADDYILTKEEAKDFDADCIIVLGALVYGDGKLSDILEDRVITGVSLFKDRASDKILMSGDNSTKKYNESGSMKKYAVSMGVDENSIHTDSAGFSTYETMYRARDIFEVKKVIIVTQKFHLSRAVYLARSLGLEAYGVESDLHTYSSESYNNIREIAARIKAVYSAVIKPDPTFLGDAIPISSPGYLSDGDYIKNNSKE